MKRIFICVFAAGFQLFLGNARVDATETETPALLPGTGLEVSDSKSLCVVVEKLPTALVDRGLTRERVEARVNSILRKNGITPLARDAFSSSTELGALNSLDISIDAFGAAFSTQLAFVRPVSYLDGKTPRWVTASTWTRASVGLDLTLGTASILEGVGDGVEIFVNDFLKANHK